jgi:hypothetical protein
MRSVWLALLCKIHYKKILCVATQTKPLSASPHNLRYVKCLLRFNAAASRNSNLKALPCGHVLAASALRAYAPLRSCPHFVSKSVRYARVSFIILFSPTAVRGHALALPCACAHSNTHSQLQKSKTKIMETKNN